jgi:predicted secreted protein
MAMSENAGGYGSAPPPPPGYGGYGGGPGPGTPPPNHLVWAILSTLFCCLPLGIASIVFAAQVNGKWTAGDYQGAAESSRKARTFALWGTIIGGIFVVLYIILIVGGVISTSGSTTTTSSL